MVAVVDGGGGGGGFQYCDEPSRRMTRERDAPSLQQVAGDSAFLSFVK